jgi:hypothetical protein
LRFQFQSRCGYVRKNPHPPLGPFSSPVPRDLWSSWGMGVSCERGTPVAARETCRGVLEGVPQASRLRSVYRGISLIRNVPLLGHYSMTILGVLWWSWGDGCFLPSRYPCSGEGHMPWGVGGSTSSFPPVEGVQGYLAHKNPPPPITMQYDYT